MTCWENQGYEVKEMLVRLACDQTVPQGPICRPKGGCGIGRAMLLVQRRMASVES
jgi:hypothetical protein